MKLSIVVPVYNSSEILVELNERVRLAVNKINLIDDFEFLMINDFSKDDSWNNIKDLSKKYSYIKGINLSRNFGQHNALMAGLNNCIGEKVITLDDDLQHPPEFIQQILQKLDDCEVCYTNYRNRQHLSWKKAVSNINNIISSLLLGKPIGIYMSSFRGLNKNIVAEIVKFKKADVYIDGLIINSTKKIKMITVDHHARRSGQSNYNFKKLLVLWSNMILNFSFLPFRLASVFGITLKMIIKIFRRKNIGLQYEILERTWKT